ASGCTVALPNTLPEVIAARMAQLTPASRRLLQTAAVLGPACVQPALQALWQGQEVLIPLLQELQRQAFYTSQTSSPEPAYSFTHALRWEVAYASLAAPERQILHRAAAQMLETYTAGDREQHDGWLACHYTHGAQAPVAIRVLSRIAVQAVTHYAHIEA